MYNRLLEINQASKHSYIIFGPRGTGKTTWLMKFFPDAIYLDLLDDGTYTELLARPTRLADKIPDGFTGWVVLDEIQKIPALLNEVHRLIEHNNIRFILTGSSARQLRQKGTNLLAGRALTLHMHPLTSIELNEHFDLEHSLNYGRLPAVFSHEQPTKYLASYVKTYLKEEVQQEGLVRNIPMFTRFLETASFSQGEVLSYTEIAREVASNRHTIVNYFDILEDLLIAYRLPVFSKRAKRNLIAHPKFYYFDVGVYRSLRPRGPLDTIEESDGAALETLFFQELKALNDYFDLNYQVYYWRTRDQVEVDFVIYGERGIHAFEVKRKSNLSIKDFKGLKLFQQDYPMAKLHMLYGGSKSYYEGNVHVQPFAQVLKHLIKNCDI